MHTFVIFLIKFGMFCEKKFKLSDAKTGFNYIICDFCADDLADKRLVDLGFAKGAKIRVVGKSFADQTFAVSLRNSVICIRKNQADKIVIKSI